MYFNRGRRTTTRFAPMHASSSQSAVVYTRLLGDSAVSPYGFSSFLGIKQKTRHKDVFLCFTGVEGLEPSKTVLENLQSVCTFRANSTSPDAPIKLSPTDWRLNIIYKYYIDIFYYFVYNKIDNCKEMCQYEK